MTYRKFIWKDSSFSSFDGASFKQMPKSWTYHSETFGLGNYRGNAFTTGCSPNGGDWKNCNRATEIFDTNDLTWFHPLVGLEKPIPDYPFATEFEYVISHMSYYSLSIIDCN